MKMEKNEPAPLYTKIYHGYGHTNNCTLFGHVFAGAPVTRNYDRSSTWQNIVHLIRLFMLRPRADVPVRLTWNQQQFYSTTASDGFFSFSWASETSSSRREMWKGVRSHPRVVLTSISRSRLSP